MANGSSKSIEQISVKISPKALGVTGVWAKKIVFESLVSEKSSGRSVSVWITDNPQIRKVNRHALRHDYATDVISFGTQGRSCFVGEKDYLGDLVVSAQMARQVARQLGISFREELARYLVHGTLHLLGYDDKKPKQRKKMFQRQEGILKKRLKKYL